MGSLKDVKQRARTLIEDPEGSILTDAGAVQKVAIIYEDAINYLANFGSPNIEASIPLLNVPQGATNLTAFQVQQPPAARAGQAGAPLAGLLNPLRIEFKQAGFPENCYCDVRFCEPEDLPHIVPGNYVTGQAGWWTWRAWQVYITPFGFPVDFLVTGEFKPPPLLKDEDVITIHPLMVSHLSYALAAMVGASRVNASYIQTWTQRAVETLDDVAAWLVRKDQGGNCRVGRMTGARRSCRW